MNFSTDNENSTFEFASLPSYYGAADNHNYGNGNFAITDPDTWSDGIDNVGKFVLASAYSGLNSFYNTGVAVARAFGSDTEYNDTAQGLSDLDSDLGQYYTQHQGAVDLAGFLVGSLVPGLAGVKVYNAGKTALVAAARTGKFGDNIGAAVGLLRPAAELNQAAANSVIATQGVFKTLTGDTVKALAGGAANSVLENAAFQVAVTATMAKSPILDQEDGLTIAKDIVENSLVFGALGGGISAIRTFGTIKKAVKEFSPTLNARTTITEGFSGLTASDRLINRTADIENMPAVLDPAAPNAAKLNAAREQTLNKLQQLIRLDTHELAGNKDPILGNLVSDIFHGSSGQAYSDAFLGVEEIGRLSSVLKFEKELKSANPLTLDKLVTYTKLFGEDAGLVSVDAPKILHLADDIKVTGLMKEADIVSAIDKRVKEFGFATGQLWNAAKEGITVAEAEARAIWAKTAKLKDGMVVHQNDIPLKERILEEWKKNEEAFTKIQVSDESGYSYTVHNIDDFERALRNSKEEVAIKLLDSAKTSDLGLEHIAAITNTSASLFSGAYNETAYASKGIYFARQAAEEKFTSDLVSKGLRKPEQGTVDSLYLPKYVKSTVARITDTGAGGDQVRAASYLMSKEKILQDQTNNVFAKFAGETTNLFPEFKKNLIQKITPYGAGQKFAAFAEGAYGSIESVVSQIGRATQELELQIKKATHTALDSHGAALLSKPEAALEKSVIDNRIHNTNAQYVLDRTGKQRLVHRELADYLDKVAAGETKIQVPKIQEGAPEYIDIKNPETFEAIKADVARNGERVTRERELRAVQGFENYKDAETYYPARPDPRQFKYVAFVVDPTVTSGAAGHVSMILARSAEELAAKRALVPAGYKSFTAEQGEFFHKAQKDFMFERTLHENKIDTDLRKAGIQSDFFPTTDPQKIVQQWVDHHLRADSVLTREMVAGKYEPQFSTLRRLGEASIDEQISRYAYSPSTAKYAEEAIKNSPMSYVKTALNISQIQDYPFLQGLNQVASSTVEKAMDVVDNVFAKTKSAAELEAVNSKLQEYGFRSGYLDAATDLIVNKSSNKMALNNFVRRANAVISTLTVRMNPFNALNNAIGTAVSLGPEVQYLLRGIKSGNAEVAGELAKLRDVLVPGTEDTIGSSSKLIASVFKDLFDPNKKAELLAAASRSKQIPDIFHQFSAIHDSLSLTGAETVQELAKKEANIYDLGKKLSQASVRYSGNAYSEVMGRVVPYGVIKKITDLAQKAGVIGPAEAESYINTFLNRVHANLTASQRPLLFSGPVGQSVGLFQSYQINLMQNAFRYIAEGTAKDTAIMAGLQSTFYGLNSLPGFSYINTHLVGTYSGNKSHTDLYSSTYGMLGQTVGDWLLYGLPSNMLQANLYSKGDLNPRNMTVVPLNPADIPIFSVAANVFSNLKDTTKNVLAGGGLWNSILQGLEHNGLVRPLAGLAQVARGVTNGGRVYATSSDGSLLGSNDLFSWASAIRLAGAKPLDEAIVYDLTYRNNAYAASDRAKLKGIGEAIKLQAAGNKGVDISVTEASEFAKQYAESGGNIKQFNQFMLHQIMSANTTRAEKLASNLKSMYAQNMQLIMGGREFNSGMD